MNSLLRKLFSAFAVMLVCSSVVQAGIVVSVTGDAELVSPPANASPDVYEADIFRVWEESTGTISDDLDLDHDGTPGDYKGNDAPFTAFNTTLTAGTPYSTAIIHLDGESEGLGSVKAEVTFSSPIIGIALLGASLDASDPYGAPGTTYPTGLVPDDGNQTRGVDDLGNDKFTISADGKTLELDFSGNGKGFDQLRVFTAGVPEPSSLLIWGTVACVVGGISRRRSRR